MSMQKHTSRRCQSEYKKGHFKTDLKMVLQLNSLSTVQLQWKATLRIEKLIFLFVSCITL